MKKLINDVQDIVPQALAGYVASCNGLTLMPDTQTVIRSDIAAVVASGQVAIVSGGGAGHEPAHCGYVGKGMLTAAVTGDVFTSPSAQAVLQAIRAVAGPGGVLLIVKNYASDLANFRQAARMADAEGIPVECVVVDDDIALRADAPAGERRGIAGTILVHKVAGAAAEAGRSLAEVKNAAEAAVSDLGSISIALSPGVAPAIGPSQFALTEHEMEFGPGIHGEAGLKRVPVERARRLAHNMVVRVAAARGFGPDDDVMLMVNNLGSTSLMELSIMTGDALTACAGLGLSVHRVLCGTFLTASDMAGVSVSLLRLDSARLEALDAGTLAPAWTSPGRRGSGLLSIGAGGDETGAAANAGWGRDCMEDNHD